MSGNVQFHSITRRQDHCFRVREPLLQSRVCLGQLFTRRERQPLARGQRCRLMRAIKYQQIHEFSFRFLSHLWIADRDPLSVSRDALAPGLFSIASHDALRIGLSLPR
jgi:hypothetical protein